MPASMDVARSCVNSGFNVTASVAEFLDRISYTAGEPPLEMEETS